MKNFIFISPQFPHTYWSFCDRLHRNGVNVLAMGAFYVAPQMGCDIADAYLNAELGSGMPDMIKITEFIRETLAIVEAYYSFTLDEQSIDCGRFITHLKFLGQRIFKKKTLPTEDSFLGDMIRKRYAHDFDCARKIGERVQELFQIVLSDEELVFLTIHLHRLSTHDNES